MPRRRRSKFGAIKTDVDGITFDSRKEARRYVELRHLLAAGEVVGLERQVRFRLSVNGMKICDYIADFTYELRDGTPVVEDVKGILTAVYRLKKKLMLAIHRIEIHET